jgi:hypothetical protein
MVYLQTTYEKCFGEAYFEYFESCDFSRENANIYLHLQLHSTTIHQNSDDYTLALRKQTLKKK